MEEAWLRDLKAEYGEMQSRLFAIEKLLETWKMGLRIAQMSGEARRVMEKVVMALEETLQSSARKVKI